MKLAVLCLIALCLAGCGGSGSSNSDASPTGADAALSTISVSPSSIPSDGKSQAQITVQLYNSSQNKITQGGDSVTISATLGSIGNVTDNGNGTYTADLTATQIGTSHVNFAVDGTASPNAATITVTGNLVGFAADSAGNIWVTNKIGNSVIELTTSAIDAGSCSPTTCPTFTGPLNQPQGITIDTLNDVWVANTGNGSVTELTPGAPSNCSSSCVNFTNFAANPLGAALLPGNKPLFSLQYSSKLVTIAPGGQSTCPANCATFNGPSYLSNGTQALPNIAVDSDGDVWVTQQFYYNTCNPNQPTPASGCGTSNGNTVTEIIGSALGGGASCSATTCINFSGFNNPQGIAADGNGDMWVANNGGGSLTEITAAAVSAGSCTSTSCVSFSGASSSGTALFSSPVGVVADTAGNIWVSNAATNTVTEVTPAAIAAGFCTNSSCIVYSRPFSSPGALLVDHGGNIWVLGQESVDEISQAAIASGSCSNASCPQVLGAAN